MATKLAESFPNLIGGRRVLPGNGSFVRVNPAQTDEVVGCFPEATVTDLEEAIGAARDAQRSWAARPAPARAEVIRRAADVVTSRVEAIARDLTREEGKTLAESGAEVRAGAAMLRYIAQLAELPVGQVLPSAREGVFIHTARQPHGLVAVLTPWNFPFSIPAFKLAAALAAGNGVVFKCSPYTPLTAWRVVEAFIEAGLPDAVLSFVTDSGGAIARALVGHPAVPAISFTGSTATGKAIAQTAARRLAACQLELGGKNALIVLDDADLDLAAAAAASGAFGGTGQKCTATGRVVIARKVLQPFLDRVLARAGEVRVGPGLDEHTTMGPLVAAERLDQVRAAVTQAQRDGAEVLVGGLHLTGRQYDGGFFMPPTVLGNVSPESAAAREEIFGPVLPVLPVEDDDHALRLANASAFGLVAGVCTRSPRRAFRFSNELHSGVVKINEATTGLEHQVPSGGWGDSGYGTPDLGPSALEFFSRLKSVYWNHTSV